MTNPALQPHADDPPNDRLARRTLALTSPRRMVGDDVRRHQKALNKRLEARSFGLIEADGEWGPLTDDANTRVKWLLGWADGHLEAATPEDQRWIAAPETRPDGYKTVAKRRWDRVLEARRTRAKRVKATIEWCREQVGVREQGGNNKGPKICAWQRDIYPDLPCGWAWCGAFVGYALKHKGKTPIVGSRIISVEKTYQDGQLQRNGMARLVRFESLKPGDLVIVDTQEAGVHNHIGLYVGNEQTVEGNTTKAGSSNDGEGVYEKPLRARSLLTAFVRPTYGVTLNPIGPVALSNADGADAAADVVSTLVHDLSEAEEAALMDELGGGV